MSGDSGMTHIGVIGCGQWGPNHIRNFGHLAGSRTLMCADLSDKRLAAMKETFRNIYPTKNYREILEHPKIDGVVIATPTATHYRFVKEALMAGKDVLCEKPLCTTEEEIEELIEIAHKKKRILMVGHVFLYNGGIRKLHELMKSGSFGQIYYLHSERTNLGPFRSDVSSVWDLAPHDIAIFNHLLGGLPLEVSARGGRYLQKKLEDVAFVSLIYPKGVLVNIHVSWLDPRKVRQITVVGEKQMVIYDDLDNIGPIKIYDRHVQPQFYEGFGEFQLLVKEGDITIPKVSVQEPLKAQDAHFLECIKTRKKPLTDGENGLEVVKVLSAIQKSLEKNGAPVRIR